ncbi:XRE family transcriptional regulator [Rheinheimera riviphila]|uniref:XRE family transcriptional regulator n=1 Tax=Rheinheimera riviphila TaxID=1834037 RepID=A0A437QIF3_9GAMM|nr:helix-turn-helix transcriptional regulator [Rheinheimera riviphila]RVU34333.1 XRE family transcriptional regulator [Rheinheimera riviphila]
MTDPKNTIQPPQRVRRSVLAEFSPSELEQRKAALCQALSENRLSMGKGAKQIRIELLGMSQQEFSAFVKLSRQTISDIENDRADLTMRSVNKLFAIIGMTLKLAPANSGN